MNTEINILVTGGAGFIGSHLCKHLLDGNSNVNVICIDDLSTGKIDNIQTLFSYGKRFSFHKKDITEESIIIGAKLPQIHQIYHLACPASPIQYGKDPLKTIRTNYSGTLHVLEVAKMNKCKLLLASTSETYGEPLEHPQKETYRGNVNTMGPRSCYDEGKRIAETLVYEYNRQYGVPIRVARIFNTYGPNLSTDDGRVVSNFLNQALASEPITIYGDGSQTRCFCYIDDLIYGLTKLMNYDDLADNHNKPIVANLGNDCEFTVNELADLIVELTESTSKIVHYDLPVDDPTRRRPDITLAKSLFGWQPVVSLRVGLEKYIRAIKAVSSKNDSVNKENIEYLVGRHINNSDTHYTSHKTADDAISYAVTEYNKDNEHQLIYCTTLNCMLELPLCDITAILRKKLEDNGSASYPPETSCMGKSNYTKIIKIHKQK